MFSDIILVGVLTTLGLAVPLERILEVSEGQTVQISCESNDRNHTFGFWMVTSKEEEEKVVIGPDNTYDENKYDYNVLNGTLYVKNTSPSDEATYTCFSKHLKQLNNLYVKSLRMVVAKDWSKHDKDVQTASPMAVIIFVACVLILIGGGYLLFKKWSTEHRLKSLLLEEDDEDDSAEDVFTAPGTSKNSGKIILDSTKRDDSLSTDFVSILSAANDER